MALNCAEIDLILEELSLEGCFVQKIRQPDFESLILDLYRPSKNRFRIGIYLTNGKTRIQPETAQPSASKNGSQRFVQLLRSRIDGARIEQCQQINSDRIVLLKLKRGSTATDLYIRLWTGAANILAVDENGVILDAFFRRPAKQEVSGEPFCLPGKNQNTKTFTPRILEGDGSYGEKIAALYAENGTAASVANESSPKENLCAPLEAQKAHTQRLLQKLQAEVNSEPLTDADKQTADLLLSQPPLPAGVETITVTDFYNGDRPLTVVLDPKLSLHENAQLFYQRHKKKKAAAAARLSRIEELKSEIEQLNEEITRLQLLSDKEALQRLSQKEKQQKKTEKSLPAGFLRFESGEFLILVGRNDKENDVLLRSYVKGNDLWFHTRDLPGGYVFIKAGKKSAIPDETIQDAAQLALWFSKAKQHGSADLYCTHVKHLRRAKNGPLGTVLPFHEKNLFVKEDKARLKRLLCKSFL